MAHSPFQDIDIVRKILITVGSIALASGAYMAFSFGASMSMAHGITLALLSFGVAVMPTMIDTFNRAGRTGTACLLMLIAVTFGSVEYLSHLGYTIGHRVGDVEQTGVQNTRYEDSRQKVADNRKNLEMWNQQLADLTKQFPWAPTISADGLEAQIATADEAIRQEEKRGGCGPKCLDLKKQKADIENRIATAKRVADLNTRIEATQRLVDSAREASAHTELRSSPIVNQTKFVGQLWTVSLEPDKSAMTWTQIAIGAAIALVTTFLAPVCFFMAFGGVDAPKATRSNVRYSVRPAQQTQTLVERPEIDFAALRMIAQDARRMLGAA